MALFYFSLTLLKQPLFASNESFYMKNKNLYICREKKMNIIFQ